MRKRIGCLHAHYSNIQYIEHALANYSVELVHYVEPGLMIRVTKDETFNSSDAEDKVKEQIEWIANTNVDAILITCTNYIALLQEDNLSVSVPIIKIDEPYFEYICKIEDPQIMLFTNPATVEGTVRRLHEYAGHQGKQLDVEVVVIDNTFELVMQGRTEEYHSEIVKFLTTLMNNDKKVISVAQLSMVEASKHVEQMTAYTIINPLNPLVTAMVEQLQLEYDLDGGL